MNCQAKKIGNCVICGDEENCKKEKKKEQVPLWVHAMFCGFLIGFFIAAAIAFMAVGK